jgi:hypothetical protein
LKNQLIPGTNQTHSCDFDKYVELSNYAVATLEVVGSSWYVGDESILFPMQNQVDPFEGRIHLYINAKNCTLDWIDQSADRASRSGKRALFFLLQAAFYTDFGAKPVSGGSVIGGYKPYDPLFAKLTKTAFQYPKIMFYVVQADGHRFSDIRMNPGLHNQGLGTAAYYSHHNLMLHMVEGASRALTMYTKFTVDDASFQPVTLKQEWSEAAYNQVPRGHSWIPYKYV